MKIAFLLINLFFSLHTWSIQIFIQEAGNAAFALELEANDTIEFVRVRIEDQTGYHPELQQLIFAGVTLEDGRTLADYNIQRDDTITLIATTACLINSAVKNGGILPLKAGGSFYFIKVSKEEFFFYSASFFPLLLLSLRRSVFPFVLVALISCGQGGFAPNFLSERDSQTSCLTGESRLFWKILSQNQALIAKGVY
jgi:hypothetical protein